MNRQDFVKIIKEKDTINFIINTKDKILLKKSLNDIANEIKNKKIEKANVIICTNPSQFIKN